MSVEAVPSTTVQDILQEAKAEVLSDLKEGAKEKLKASLATISKCKLALANAERAHEVLLRTIGADINDVA